MNVPGLLVSVRDGAEVEEALLGGADLIDVKDPGEGSLGKASDETIRQVLRQVACRRPVSAAFGELTEGQDCSIPGLAFAKWGLAGCSGTENWEARLERRAAACPPGTVLVSVAYADWRCAAAPSLSEVCAHALRKPGGVLLIDTHCKNAAGSVPDRPAHLLDWVTEAELEDVSTRCRQAGVKVALAGSLGEEEIRRLMPLGPDWFAVRRAACEDGRNGRVVADRVRRLACLVRGFNPTKRTAG